MQYANKAGVQKKFSKNIDKNDRNCKCDREMLLKSILYGNKKEDGKSGWSDERMTRIERGGCME